MGLGVANRGKEVGEQAAGQARHEAGKGEGQKLRAGGADGVRRCRVGVVSYGEDSSADCTVAKTIQDQQCNQRHDEREQEIRLRTREIQAHDRASRERRRPLPSGEERPLVEVVERSDCECERRDREHQASDAQRTDAGQGGDRCGDEGSDDDGNRSDEPHELDVEQTDGAPADVEREADVKLVGHETTQAGVRHLGE